MEAVNENDAKEDVIIVRNPTHCMALITMDKMSNSSFMAAIGVMGDILLQRIKRPAPGPTTRSPWGVKNLSIRHVSTVPNFYKELLVQESKMLLNLDSTNIAGAMSSGSLDECKRNLAVDYCSIDLAEILAQRYNDNLGPLEAPKAIKASLHILNALDYLHRSVLILHGDVKSFNILVQGEFENVKLCGLGRTSKSLSPDGTVDEDCDTASDLIGVGLWSAPEVFVKNAPNITTKADIFSFGLVVYEMIVCMPPHTFPGIMDLVIARPGELIKARNAQKRQELEEGDDDTDELDVSVQSSKEDMQKNALSKKREGTCFARKRQMAENKVSGNEKQGAGAIKKIKYDEVIIDLVEEEEPTKEETDSIGKENEPFKTEENATQKDNNADNAIKTDESSVEKANDVKDEGLAAPAVTDLPETKSTTDVNQATKSPHKVESSNEAMPAVSDGSIAENENPPVNSTIADKVAETLPVEKVESTTGSVQDGPAPTNRPEASPEVVTVFDSSDEDNDTPIKSYEVESSDSSIHDYGSEEEDAYKYPYESEDDFDGADDEITEVVEDEWDIDGNFLNYGCLGTRPPIPAEITLGKEYNILLEMFYACTKNNFALRPSAEQLLKAYEANKSDQS